MTSGDLVGTVVDNTGALVPNVSITATNQATNVKTTTTTNASGEYRFTNLPVGSYTLSASAQGFSTTGVKDVQVVLNQTNTQKITMSVGQVATTVEVSAAAPPIDTT